MSAEKFYEFQVGDIASFGGLEGVIGVANSINYPVMFVPKNREVISTAFTSDGRLFADHVAPTLILIRKARRKVTKTLTVYANIYVKSDGSHHVSGYYYNAETARNNSFSTAIVEAVKLTGTYEVEE